MASAKKCDICGRYYDEDKGSIISVQNEPANYEAADIFDLCPSHKDMLIRMLNGNDTVSFYKTKEA